jgi:hypothetical protein
MSDACASQRRRNDHALFLAAANVLNRSKSS